MAACWHTAPWSIKFIIRSLVYNSGILFSDARAERILDAQRCAQKCHRARQLQHQAGNDAILKKQTVWNAGLQKTLTLPGKPPPTKVSMPEFDAAWDGLAEPDRTTLDAAALATRIIERVAAQQAALPPP